VKNNIDQLRILSRHHLCNNHSIIIDSKN